MADRWTETNEHEPEAPSASSWGSRANGYGYLRPGGRRGLGDSSDLRTWFRMLRKHRWLIGTITVVVTVVVGFAAARVENTYQAQGTLQVENENQPFIGTDRFIITYSDPVVYFNTQLQLLRSKELAAQVAYELDLEHNSRFHSSRPATLTAALLSLGTAPSNGRTSSSAAGITPTDGDVRKDSAALERLEPLAAAILAGLDVERVRDTQLVSVTFRHHDPEIAAKVVNALNERFVQQNLERTVSSNASAADFLQKRIAELQTEVRAGEERMMNIGRQFQVVSMEGEGNTEVERLTSLNRALLEAENDRKSLETVYEQLQRGTDIDSLDVVQNAVGYQTLTQKLNELKAKRAELLTRYTPEWPEVKTVDSQIGEIEGQLADVRKQLASSIAARYQTALAQEKKLRESFEESRSQLMGQNEASINYRILQQEVETNKKLLSDLLTRSKEMGVQSASQRNNITIASLASIPRSPVGPNRQQTVALAFLLALGTGVGLAFLREYLDTTIKSVEDIDEFIQLPSLGVIPAIESTAVEQAAQRVKRLLPSASEQPNRRQLLLSQVGQRSSAAEAYRQLRTSVLLSSAGHASRRLLVTSSQPKEGKTTTAVNTAISFAQTGASVVIVDCDMRRPCVHRMLNVPNHRGLSLYLTGQDCNLDSLVHKHQIPNLSVLPCGPVPPNPAELLGSDAMRELVSELAGRYDHIILDSSPIISFADPQILSTLVDGVLLVVRGGVSNREVVAHSRQLLDDVGARIYGVVLNDADTRASRYYYYSRYYYEQYYDPNEERAYEEGEAERARQATDSLGSSSDTNAASRRN
jgi:capsular exopolysaccharide synthesis family protein